MPLSVIYLLIIFLCTFSFFSLGVPFFNPTTGLILILLGLGVALFRNKELGVLKNSLTLLICIYLVFVYVQVSLTSFNYEQSIFRGVIAARRQLYYLIFFLFLLLLNSREKINLFIKSLSFFSFAIVALSMVNYFGVTIFQSNWAEGHGTRGGMVRAFVPSMDLMAFALFWHFSNWMDGRNDGKAALSVLLFLGIHFFRQTRMRIIAVILTMATILIAKKKYKELIVAFTIGIMAVGIAQFSMKENILLSSFSSVAGDLEDASGTWSERDRMIQVAFDEFQEYPIAGSGLLTLSLKSSEMSSKQFEELTLKRKLTDLGYVSWLKAFGILGIIWLLIFIGILLASAYRAYQLTKGDDRKIALTCICYFIFVIISNVTLGHFLDPYGILLICFCGAVSYRLIDFNKRGI